MPTTLSDGTVLIPHRADWTTRPKSGRRWETAIASGGLGGEDRDALRQVPLGEIEYAVLPFDVAEQELLLATLRAAKRVGNAAVPRWGRGIPLAAAAASGATTLTAAAWVPAAWMPAAGDLLIWFGDWATAGGAAWWTVEVLSVSGSTINLVTGIPQAVEKLALFWNLLRGQFECDDINHIAPTTGRYTIRVKGPIANNPGPSETIIALDEYRVYWGRCGHADDLGPGLYYLPYFAFREGVSVAPYHNQTELRTTLARAGGYEYSASTVPLTVATSNSSLSIIATPWTRTQVIPKFNAALGTLVEVELTFRNTFQTTPRVESLDTVPRTVTVGGQATNLLKDPGANTLVTSVASRTVTGSCTAYDGTTDFGGPGGGPGSGFSSPPISSFTDVVRTLTAADGALFTQFIGAGNITLTASSTSIIIVTGTPAEIHSVSNQSGATTTRKFKYAALTGYWWFAVEVLSGWDPVSFLKSSDGTPLPMATMAEMGTTFEAHGFGRDQVTDLAGKVYWIYRSRDELYALTDDTILVS